jgi:two-component system response regulator HydG
MTQKNILIIDDEKNHRHMLRLHLEDAGYICSEAGNGALALAALAESAPDLILLDITMDVMDGLTFLSYIRGEGNNTPVIIITASNDAKIAVSAMKLGAADFLTKPVDTAELLDMIKAMPEKNEQEAELPSKNYKFEGVYSESGLGKIIDLLAMVAPTDATVLIMGESGTGKELIARSIHDNSARAGKPFVAVNAAALNENLIESELFGHVKGAFTGATADRKGRLQEAAGGTIFLDEIGELPLSTQAKLLRVLQEKTFELVGSSKTVQVDVRIIAATNKDLEQMSAKGDFRQDLYFRLAVFPVYLPPLRDRQSEISVLTEFFVKKHADRFQKKVNIISRDYMKKLMNYDFPGNIRELENLVERSIILARNDTLTEELLPNFNHSGSHGTILKEQEKDTIISVLKSCDNNKTKAAEKLGISRRALYYKLKEYGIDE